MGPTTSLYLLARNGLSGKTHKQATGAVMSHLGARVLSVLREDRPYELQNTEGRPISSEEARRFILSKYRVPDDIRRERRQRKRRKGSPLELRIGRQGTVEYHRIRKVAIASQPEIPAIPQGSVYLVGAEKSS